MTRPPTLSPAARLLAVALLELASAAQPVLAQQSHGWPVSSAAAQHVDSAVWLALDADVRAGTVGLVDGVTVIRNGVMVFDRDYRNDYATIYRDSVKDRGPFDYYAPEWHPYYRGTSLHTLQSVTKSVTSALIGIAIDRKEISGISAPVLGLLKLPDGPVANVDDRKRRMTLRDLLTMTAGLDWDETSVRYEDPRNIGSAMERSADWVRYTIDRPMSDEPGARFNYSSGVSHLLSRILLSATGMSAEAYAKTYLFGPMGITNYYWKVAPGGLNDTEGGLYLDRYDLARIGQLYLDGGARNGKQLVPAEWVRQTVTPAVRVRGTTQYGFQWWLLTTDSSRVATSAVAWYGSGYGGQTLLVLPEQRMVIVATSWGIAGKRGMPMRRLLDAARMSAHP